MWTLLCSYQRSNHSQRTITSVRHCWPVSSSFTVPDVIRAFTRCVQRSLIKNALRSLVRAFIHCQLDYCNAFLAGITDTQIKQLQSVHNTAAGSLTVWSTTSEPHPSSHTQPPLASDVAKDHFQDCGPHIEIHPRRRTSISAILRAGGESSRRSSTVVGNTSTGCVDVPRIRTSLGQRKGRYGSFR